MNTIIKTEKLNIVTNSNVVISILLEQYLTKYNVPVWRVFYKLQSDKFFILKSDCLKNKPKKATLKNII